MKKVVVFPGQGSQTVGMGKELAAAFPTARQVFQEVDDALSQNLSSLMFEGPEGDLTLTENAQPAIMANSMAILRTLEVDFGFTLSTYASYLAGHSLGEYSALCAARSFSLSETAKLLKLRGQAMQRAVPAGEGAMAAILGLDYAAVEEVVNEVSDAGVCTLANDNSPGQIVISGDAAAVMQACELAKLKGAKRALLLPVSAPFHCPLMKPAAEEMEIALSTASLKTPILPIIANVTAEPVHEPEVIRNLLVEQVTGQVRWRESVETMAKLGVTYALELGTGKVLTGLIKRTVKEIDAVCVALPADLELFAKAHVA